MAFMLNGHIFSTQLVSTHLVSTQFVWRSVRLPGARAHSPRIQVQELHQDG
jgi:hypothetical protein